MSHHSPRRPHTTIIPRLESLNLTPPTSSTAGSSRSFHGDIKLETPARKRRKSMPKGKAKVVKSRAGIAKWPFENEKLLIELMHEESIESGPPSPNFSPEAWDKICAKLNGLLSPNYTYQVGQLKGKFCRIRMAWRLFNHLLTKESGYSWDNERHRLTGNPQHIAKWIVDHPDDALIIEGRLPRFDLLSEIFQNGIANGSMARSSSRQPRSSNEERRVNEIMTGRNHSQGRIQVNRVDLSMDTTHSENGANTTTAQSRRTEEPEGGESSSRRRKVSEKIEKQTRMLSALQKRDDLIDAKLARIGPKAEKSVEECLVALRRMDGLPQSLFFRAINNLQSATMRTWFLYMDDREKRGWVESLGLM
ncbi:hypothetical protein BUALT_Bualt06G0028200 [Buddleja alternifolia]|uniref:Myb/SANT-like domain-containing protein n=1 Tax=Buddleja alternifolia TaxID=168488 RepID=A0AAV6XDL6_9LAMI|nr:hypothetical protein BUALT_Bualt06G0028200 [Buddleja alternifolia]